MIRSLILNLDSNIITYLFQRCQFILSSVILQSTFGVKMFYYYFRAFNWLCTIFGMKKPFLMQNERACKITYWNKLWSVIVIATFIVLDTISINAPTELGGFKNYLHDIADANNLIFNIIIITIDFSHDSRVWSELYVTFNSIFSRLNLSNKNLKMASLKLYMWIFLINALSVSSIFMEIVIPRSSHFVVLIKFPSCLATLHLMVHLYLVLAVLKVLNNNLINAKPFHIKATDPPYLRKQQSICMYLLNTDISFMKVDDLRSDYSISFLCKVYDDLITSIQLLEKLHGKQILCTIWLMFSGAVIGATLISCKEIAHPCIIIIRMVQPFIWFYLCCFVDDQLRKEVEWTEIVIMKHLIDFKCDLHKKKVLETFKLLVSTNKLEFTAGNLFHVNYNMILGTIMNVITYSIILIQLFLSRE